MLDTGLLTAIYRDGGYQETIGLLMKLGADRELAREVASEAWLKAIQHVEDLKNESSFLAWVKTIARNELMSFYRRKRPIQMSPIMPEPSVTLVNGQAVIDARELLARCKPADGALLWAFYAEGLTIAEIAAETGRTCEALHSALYRARLAAKAVSTQNVRHSSTSSDVVCMKAKREPRTAQRTAKSILKRHGSPGEASPKGGRK